MAHQMVYEYIYVYACKERNGEFKRKHVGTHASRQARQEKMVISVEWIKSTAVPLALPRAYVE